MGGAGDGHGLTFPAGALDAVAAALRHLAPHERVVLAVSGGPDSVGMAWLVRSARPDIAAAVVHVRHGLRDDSADADAAVAHARALDLPWRVVPITVTDTGTGPEDAARRGRLTALADAAVAARAAAVLVGHTADDQAETVLLNVARGAGLPGLAGIPARRRLTDGVDLVRPVLGLRRDAVRQVAIDTGLPVVNDPTNADPAQRRARARHALLPQLASLTGGGTDPVVALNRLARHARRDTEALDAMAAARLAELGDRWGPVRTIRVDALNTLPEALTTRVIRLLLTRPGGTPPDEATVFAVGALRDGQALTLPGGGMATRGGGVVAVALAEISPLPSRTGDHTIALPELELTLHRAADAPPRPALPPWAPPRAAAAVAVAAEGQLRVRSRRAGDRVVTAAGTQGLADAMTSARVPRVARDLLPVVEDRHGIVWVPGVAVRAGASGPARLYFTPSPSQ